MLQYYAGHISIPRAAGRPARARRAAERAAALRRGARQPPRRAGRAARGRARREAQDPRAGRAQRAAGARPGAPARRAPPPEPRGGARGAAAGARAGRRRRSGSSASTSPISAARRRSPRWSCSRAARRRSPTTAASRSARSQRGRSDDYAAMAEVLARRFAQWEAPGRHLPARPRLRRELRRAAEPGRDRRRQGPARGRPRRRCAAFASAASRSSRWPSASRSCSSPGARAPLVLDHSTPELQLLQRVRDEAHRFAITHHRTRRDRAMTSSLLDELPGVGPARKRALLAHFGSPEAVVAASQRGAPGGARPAGEGRAGDLHGLPAPAPAEPRLGSSSSPVRDERGVTRCATCAQ